MHQHRILFSITSLMQGGAERWCYDLAQALHKRGAAVAVVATHNGPFRETLNAAGIPVTLISGFFFRYDPVWWIQYLRAVQRFQPTIIIGALWIGNSAGRIAGTLLRIPTILTLHAQQTHEGALRTVITRTLSMLPGHRVAVSPQIVGADSIIENGIDLSRIPVKNNYAPEKEFRVLCVGRLVHVKRFDRAIEVVAALRKKGLQIVLDIIGDGPLRPALAEQIHTHALEKHVHLLGQQDAAPHYAQADCFIQTSDSEGLSLALLEALAAGLPAVVTHTDFVHPVVRQGETGIIALLPNPERALTNALRDLYHDAVLRKKLGLQGQQLVATRFAHEQMVEKYCTLIQSVQ